MSVVAAAGAPRSPAAHTRRDDLGAVRPRRGWLGRDGRMTAATILDREAIARACIQFGVQRLRLFGSAVSDRFDPVRSDVDFLVDFLPGRDNLFDDYFGLRAELERIVGRSVDLVVARSVKNPYFKASAFNSAQEVYAA